MSDRAREFLVNWLSKHACPLPDVKRMAEAVRLATACRKDATAAGIPPQEVRDEAEGDLILKILQALDMAAALAEEVGIAPEIGTRADDRRVGATMLDS